MQIDYDISNWLISIGVLPKQDKPNTKVMDGKVDIEGSLARHFENGLAFGKIIRVLINTSEHRPKITIVTMTKLNQLKDLNTPAAKLYNWNIIAEILAKLNFRIDQDMKALIIAGDIEMINELLKDLYAFSKKTLQPSKKDIIDDDNTITTSRDNLPIDQIGQYSKKKTNQGNVNKQIPKLFKNKSEIMNLGQIDMEAPLSETESLLGFLILSLSRSLALTIKQSTGLLMSGNKYLAHVIVKGIKKNFIPILNWYEQVYSNSKHLLQLIIKEQSMGSIPLILQALKPGLLSRSEDVAKWACRLFSKLAFDFSNLDFLSEAWEWFINDNGGLYASLACMKRHQDIGSNVAGMMAQFGKDNLVELFTIEMRKLLEAPLDYMNYILKMLRPLTEIKIVKDDLVNSSIVDYWIEFGLKQSDAITQNSTPNIRSIALSLLCNLWELYPLKIENDDRITNSILTMLKRAIRDKNNSLRLIALTYFFRLLDNFAAERNPYAPVIYKILTFSLIENYNIAFLREFIINNFIDIFNTSPSIPVGILIEPLIKCILLSDPTATIAINPSIVGSSSIGNLNNSGISGVGSGSNIGNGNSLSNDNLLNVYDFRLLKIISIHQKLLLKHGIQILDLLAKIYLNSITYAQIASESFLNIITRFIEEEALQEFLIKYSKISLSLYYSSLKKKKTKERIKKFIELDDKNDLFSGITNITPEQETEILNAQKRALIIEMFKNIINIKCDNLNIKIKALIIHTNKQIKLFTRYDNKGLKYIISLFGDPDLIIKEFEDDQRENQEILKGLKSQQKENIQQDNVPGFDTEADTTKSNGTKGLEPITHNGDSTTKSIMKAKSKAIEEKKDIKIDNFFEDGTNRSNIVMMKKSTTEANFDIEDETIPDESARNVQDDLPEKFKNSKLGIKKSRIKQKQKKGGINGDKGDDNDPKNKELLNQLKVLEALDDIKKRNEDKRLQKELELEDKKKREERTKSLLRKHLEKRKIELGVQSKVNNYLLGDTSVISNKETIKPSKKPVKLNEIQLIDLDIEEDFQREAVAIDIRANLKKFKYLFHKYANVGPTYKKLGTFDAVQTRTNTINIPEMWKLIREHNMSHLISKEEIIHMFKLINTIILGKDENISLDFEGFLKYIPQISILMFTREPIDLSYRPYSDCLKRFIYLTYQAAKQRGEHLQMLDDPIVMNNEELEKLNEDIKINPNVKLPEGYKKIMESQIEYRYELPRGLKITQKYKICYEIVCDLVKKAFEQGILVEFISLMLKFNRGMQVIEGISKITTNYKVISMPKIQLPALIQRGNSMQDLRSSININEFGDKIPVLSSKKTLINSIEDPQNLGLKKKPGLNNITNSENKLLINKALEDKVKKEREIQQKNDEKEAKRKARQQEIQNKLKELMEKKKDEADKKKEEDNQQKKEEIDAERLKEIQKKKALEMKKKLLKELKEKKLQQEKVKEEKENEEKQKRDKEKRKEEEEFFKKQKELLDKKFETKKKEREEKLRQKKEKEKLEKEREAKTKKKLEEIIIKERQRREKQKELNKKISEIYKSKPFQDVFKAHEKELHHVFKYYKEDPLNDLMPYSAYMHFASQFNILPSLLSPEQTSLIFRSLTHDKSSKSQSLSYDEFLQALFRISIKSQGLLNAVYSKNPIEKQGQDIKVEYDAQDAMKNQDQLREIINDEKMNQGENPLSKEEEQMIKDNVNLKGDDINKEKDDEYENIENVTVETLEGLMIFLDMPKNPKSLNEKLKSLRTENAKIVPPRDKKNVIRKNLKGSSSAKSLISNAKSSQTKASNKKSKKTNNKSMDELTNANKMNLNELNDLNKEHEPGNDELINTMDQNMDNLGGEQQQLQSEQQWQQPQQYSQQQWQQPQQYSQQQWQQQQPQQYPQQQWQQPQQQWQQQQQPQQQQYQNQTNFSNMNIRGPDGKVENWKIQRQYKKNEEIEKYNVYL